MSAIKAGWRYLLALLFVWRKADAPEQVPELETEEPAPLVPAKARRKEPASPDPDAKFMHLEDLLKQIDMCHKLLRRYKQHDWDAYQYHRRVGARLLPRTAGVWSRKLSDEAFRLMPSEGMRYSHPMWFDDELAEQAPYYTVPMFVYFTKRAANIWGVGTLYRLHLAWWSADPKGPAPDDSAFPEAEECHHAIGFGYDVLVQPDGRAKAVPQPEVVCQKIRHRDRMARWHPESSVTHSGMRISPYLKQLYDDWVDRQRKRGKAVDETMEEFGGSILVTTINFHVAGHGKEQYTVLAEKKGIAARFDVQLGKPKAFFKDREISLARDGRRKRIIHWVEPHDRVLADGTKVSVIGHFRGATTFDWHGSTVRVLLPQNTLDPRGFPVPVYLRGEDDIDFDQKDFVDAKHIGSRVRDEWLKSDPKQPEALR